MKELNTFRKFLNEGGSIKAEEATVAVNLNQPMTVTFNVDDFGSDEEFHKFVFDLHNDESVAYGAFFQNFDLNSFLDRKADQEKFTVSVTDDSGIMNEGELNEQITPEELRKEFYKGMQIMDSALAKAKGVIPQEQWNALYAAVTKVEDEAEFIGGRFIRK